MVTSAGKILCRDMTTGSQFEFDPQVMMKLMVSGHTVRMVDGGEVESKKCDSPVMSFREFAGADSEHDGKCFSRACMHAGVDVGDAKSVVELSSVAGAKLAANRDFKVFIKAYGMDDIRNHLIFVRSDTGNVNVKVRPVGELESASYTLVCTSMQHFFNASNEWANYKFYSEAGFGAESLGLRGGRVPPPPESVVDERESHGSANISHGVARSKKRNISAKSKSVFGRVAGVERNYGVTGAILFNNADEMFQDSISRDYAQEIVEALFEAWEIPMGDVSATTFAENLLWLFIISVTASNKADYTRIYEVPVKPINRDGVNVTSVDADFSIFSRLLESKFGVTRRQFARGVADDLKAYLKHEDNQHLLPTLATRVGCEPMLAYLAFDGSTHCTGLTTREASFTKTLESRNLFERDDELASGASDRLMQGMSGGIRSIAPR